MDCIDDCSRLYSLPVETVVADRKKGLTGKEDKACL